MRFWVVWLLLLPCVLGANIYGSVYDYSLNEVSNSVVEINSPRQVMVAKDGQYSFAVSPGYYTIKARSGDLFFEENISVSEGSFVFDIILLPQIDFESDFEEPPFVEDIVQDSPAHNWIWFVLFAVAVIVVLLVVKYKTRIVEKKLVVSDDLNRIVDFVEKQGGRATQKDIRKQFPYSEAKISLMIDDLESRGLLKRIKKGRGNIIVRE